MSTILVGVVVATAALAMAACSSARANPGGISHPSGTKTDAVGSSCSSPTGAPSLTLTDMSPTPTVTVPVGTHLVVLVPPWSDEEETPLHLGDPSVVGEECSVTLPDHGTRTILLAGAPGTSTVSATVKPGSDTMMPAWLGTVVVTGGGS
jgi:hypothetical protein